MWGVSTLFLGITNIRSKNKLIIPCTTECCRLVFLNSVFFSGYLAMRVFAGIKHFFSECTHFLVTQLIDYSLRYCQSSKRLPNGLVSMYLYYLYTYICMHILYQIIVYTKTNEIACKTQCVLTTLSATQYFNCFVFRVLQQFRMNTHAHSQVAAHIPQNIDQTCNE